MPALPSLRQLRYLVALSERLNFRLAAEDCFVTQSTLSAGIKELESLLGVELVERDTRSVRLTDVGAEVVARARALLAQAQDLVDVAKGALEPLSGLLRLGVIPTIAPFMLPGLLPPLRAAASQAQALPAEDLTDRLLERLRSGDLDVALIALPYDTGELLVRKLFKDEFWFVARADDPLAQAKEVPVRALRAGPDPASGGGALPARACHRGLRHARGEPRLAGGGDQSAHPDPDGGGRAGRDAAAGDDAQGGHPQRHLAGRAAVLQPRCPSRTIALAARPTSAHRRDFDLLAEFITGLARQAAAVRLPSRRIRAQRR